MRLSPIILSTMMLHVKCRGTYYPRTQNTIKRFVVPDDKVKWSVAYPEYQPPDYTADYVISGQVWADPDISEFTPHWNTLDGILVSRISYSGLYDIGPDGRPLNPCGRTGLAGRGCLGRWGPNHAADPIVTRWARNADGEIATCPQSKRPVLQFVAIMRGDCGEWALPGGMVDPGEVVSKTLQREFLEEALDSASPEQAKNIKNFFDSGGKEVYRGYVDDPRNTDNAWMETVAVHFHDEKGETFGNVELRPGDDAVGVRWQNLTKDLKMYASHIDFLEQVAKSLNAHW